MKRQLTFDYADGKYVIKEAKQTIFSIDGKDLKFVSLDFYNGIYKNKSAAIELVNAIKTDELKKGNYIFAWLNEIISSIQNELNDPEPIIDELPTALATKMVYLYDLSACAGSGFYSDGASDINSQIESPFADADYAVTISGKSMEPTISDGSVIFVKKTDIIFDKEIGIFVVDGNIMCKRYRENETQKWLEPDNSSPEYSPIYLNEGIVCEFQGKVLL